MSAKILLPVGLLLVASLGMLSWLIQARASDILRQTAEQELSALSMRYGNEVRAFLEMALGGALTLAEGVESAMSGNNPPSRAMLVDMLAGVARSESAFLAAGSAWEPDAFDGRDAAFAGATGNSAEGRFLPYVASGQPVTALENVETSAYYTESRRRMRPYVSDPYSYTIDGRQVRMTTAAAPVVINGAFKGVAVVDISLDTLIHLVSGIKIYKSGYGGLMTSEGLIVAHRDAALVGQNRFQLRTSSDIEALRAAIRAGRPYLEERPAADGRPAAFVSYTPVSLRGTGQNWYFYMVVPAEEVLAGAAALSRLTLLASAGVVLLALACIFLIVRSVVRPMAYLADVSQKISRGQLDLTIEDERFGGEVRQLSGSLKTMIASLLESLSKAEAMSADANAQADKAREAMRDAEAAGREARAKSESMLRAADKLEEVANIVSSASNELSAQIEQSERGASEQASRMAETAAAMEEMNSTVLEVAKNAGAASDVSVRTREKADQGAGIVRRAVDSIRQVQEESLALKEDMAALSGHARSIDQIMGVISDIADQTNLLALNAAIEAARAGEAGRGFAVVADEVRKLAEKTMSSTTDVGNAIRAIQNSAEKSMAQVDRAVKTIEEATGFANQSGAALEEIVGMVDDTADQVRAIATASEQQSASSEEINQSVTQVNTIAGETAQAMAESAKAVSDLSNQAQVLARLIDDMKRG